LGERAEKQGLILVYTGNGKGKTSAAVGQAVRALGSGIEVAFGQFLKRDNQAGEQKVLKSLLGKNFMASGIGFLKDKKDRQKHREGAQRLLEWASEKFRGNCGMLILDEALYALKMELITRDELEKIIDQASRSGISMVLTGRDIPRWLKEKADLVSEILEIKHHYQQNIPARKGIEF
jgi:cob(I)alamin adenosyltransferase